MNKIAAVLFLPFSLIFTVLFLDMAYVDYYESKLSVDNMNLISSSNLEATVESRWGWKSSNKYLIIDIDGVEYRLYAGRLFESQLNEIKKFRGDITIGTIKAKRIGIFPLNKRERRVIHYLKLDDELMYSSATRYKGFLYMDLGAHCLLIIALYAFPLFLFFRKSEKDFFE